MAQDRAGQAVVSAMTPICVEHAKADPNAATLIAELQEQRSFQRRNNVEEAGWAGDNASRALLEACANALADVDVTQLGAVES